MKQNNKNIKNKFITLIILFLVFILCLIFYKRNTKPIISTNSKPIIGQLCNNLSNKPIENPDGLQCYFYNNFDVNGKEIDPRLGIWIKPDLKPQILLNFTDVQDSWRKFISSDNNVSFLYPSSWKVIPQWNNEDILVSKDEVGVYIHKKYGNTNDMEEEIKLDTQNHTYIKNNYDLNGSLGTIIQIAPEDNLVYEQVEEIFIPKNGYYYKISTTKSGYASSDFLSEYILSTLVLK
jgi:hypothetical protein